jgi:hypothetical protein
MNPDFIPTDGATSHSTKSPKIGDQVAGYAGSGINCLRAYHSYAALHNSCRTLHLGEL